MRFGAYVGYNQNPDWCEHYLNTRSLENIIARISHSEGQDRSSQELFQNILDSELNKIEMFYLRKEKELLVIFMREYYHFERNATTATFSPLRWLCCETQPEMQKRDLIAFFKQIDALRNFSSLNYLAIKQVFSHYERALPQGQSFKEQTIQRVKRMQFHSSHKLRKLHNDVELLFAEAFCEASVTDAKLRLRPKKFGVRDLFCGGMLVGISLALLLALLMLFGILSGTSDIDLDSNKYFLSAFPVFRFLAFPVIALWCWCFLLVAFQKTTINYVYILQLDSSSIISYMEVMRMAATYSVIWFVCYIFFLMSMLNFFPHAMTHLLPASIYPFIAFLFFFVLFFCPLNCFWRATRVGFIWTFVQILLAPFGRLQFRDFLVADIFTSLIQNFVDTGYTLCWIGNGGFISKNATLTAYDTCLPIGAQFFRTIVPLLPYWWRFAQCLNKYYYTRKAFPHLINAGKYFTGIVFVTVMIVNVLSGESSALQWNAVYILGLVCRLANSMYCFVWDVVMDWGLCSNRKLLRDELLLQSTWKYYGMILFDFVARLAWIPEIWVRNMFADTQAYPTAIFALIEIVRRSLWVFFRIEWEVMSNNENYRVIDVVPRLGPMEKDESADAIMLPNEPLDTGISPEATATSNYFPIPKRVVLDGDLVYHENDKFGNSYDNSFSKPSTSLDLPRLGDTVLNYHPDDVDYFEHV